MSKLFKSITDHRGRKEFYPRIGTACCSRMNGLEPSGKVEGLLWAFLACHARDNDKEQKMCQKQHSTNQFSCDSHHSVVLHERPHPFGLSQNPQNHRFWRCSCDEVHSFMLPSHCTSNHRTHPTETGLILKIDEDCWRWFDMFWYQFVRWLLQ